MTLYGPGGEALCLGERREGKREEVGAIGMDSLDDDSSIAL